MAQHSQYNRIKRILKKFYYAKYEDNLFCPLGEQALKAYDNGSGAETRPTEKW